jgi:hypothetical protein
MPNGGGMRRYVATGRTLAAHRSTTVSEALDKLAEEVRKDLAPKSKAKRGRVPKGPFSACISLSLQRNDPRHQAISPLVVTGFA